MKFDNTKYPWIEESHLIKRVSLEEAQAANMVSDERLSDKPVPFGFMNFAWGHLLSLYNEGDELWEYRNSPESWADLSGKEGYVLLRNGKIVDEITTGMS